MTELASVAPFVYWIGMEPGEPLTPDELRDVEQHYNTVHVAEVVDRNPGFVSGRRWIRSDAESSSSASPLWLAMYDIDTRAAADAYLDRVSRKVRVSPEYTAGPPAWKKLRARWRVVWEVDTAVGDLRGCERAVLLGLDADPAGDAAAGDMLSWAGERSPAADAESAPAAVRLRRYRTISDPDGTVPRQCVLLGTPDRSGRAAPGAAFDAYSAEVRGRSGGGRWLRGYRRAVRDVGMGRPI
ncbi:hypothetical protein GTZ78_10795 [Streptomyces sp. SID8361]|uniref:hypothetical protein n=1 Tax=Streptomyces sp. MnatMP-M27 TaxID=1839768 RepID=UPI00081F70E3|nr:hypothetical protein [Streptomyces sp. MnatMP-M27]MYU11166.1 hypothetical protein [Streptomyces sp. SID8361]SCF78861.1 hypothetical protein GA0115260_1024710 [Streptomyces sp. MnatMP-M27]